MLRKQIESTVILPVDFTCTLEERTKPEIAQSVFDGGYIVVRVVRCADIRIEREHGEERCTNNPRYCCICRSSKHVLSRFGVYAGKLESQGLHETAANLKLKVNKRRNNLLPTNMLQIPVSKPPCDRIGNVLSKPRSDHASRQATHMFIMD